MTCSDADSCNKHLRESKIQKRRGDRLISLTNVSQNRQVVRSKLKYLLWCSAFPFILELNLRARDINMHEI